MESTLHGTDYNTISNLYLATLHSLISSNVNQFVGNFTIKACNM